MPGNTWLIEIRAAAESVPKRVTTNAPRDEM
jgi:hypothetical protein